MDVLGDVTRVMISHPPNLQLQPVFNPWDPAVFRQEGTVRGSPHNIPVPGRFLFELIKIGTEIVSRNTYDFVRLQEELGQARP